MPGRGPVVAADPSRPARGEPTRGVGDRLGRPLRDLRVSVTDRCNFRCPYCMPKTVFGRDHAFLPRAEILSFEEITRVVGAAAALVTALAELGSMTGGRLRLDRATILDPVANALPQAKQPGLARRRHAHWWARDATAQPTPQPRTAEPAS